MAGNAGFSSRNLYGLVRQALTAGLAGFLPMFEMAKFRLSVRLSDPEGGVNVWSLFEGFVKLEGVICQL